MYVKVYILNSINIHSHVYVTLLSTLVYELMGHNDFSSFILFHFHLIVNEINYYKFYGDIQASIQNQSSFSYSCIEDV